ncbi:MAG: MBL fold metallo-hydrolase [Planctomycetota bacterium]
MDASVISIGTLSANDLWDERKGVRTGHATTTLIRDEDRLILVDPGLPPEALSARLGERANLRPEAITDVFITRFAPDTTRGLGLFDEADWWIAEREREAVGAPLAMELKRIAEGAADAIGVELKPSLEREISVLQRTRPAPDRLGSRVALFPLPGVSPGLTGLLVEEASRTTLIAGDAVLTGEHLAAGRVAAFAHDVELARESFQEAIEIADVLICGRDNLVINPVKRPF